MTKMIFISTYGYMPFDTRVDPGREKSIQMIKDKEAQLALEAGKKEPEGEAIDAPKPNTGDTDADQLVSVDIPPLPSATFDPRSTPPL